MNKAICFGASKHRNSGTGSYCAHMHLLSVCSKSDPKSTRTVIDELQQHVAHRSCCWFLSKRALQFVLPAVYFECLYWSGVGVGMVLNSTLSLSLSARFVYAQWHALPQNTHCSSLTTQVSAALTLRYTRSRLARLVFSLFE